MRHFALLVALLLSSCASSLQEPEPILGTAPTETVDLRAAALNAVHCEMPIVAEPKLTKSFKYGCFCGVNHPNLQLDRSSQNSGLTDLERHELIKKYYSIKPIDDIDRACQSHDVCWIFSGKPLLKCNQQFRNTLDYLERKFQKKAPRISMDINDRCASLALDMGAATLFVMEGVDEDAAIDAGSQIGRILNIPAAAIFAGLVSLGVSQYPRASERCFVNIPVVNTAKP
jgi:hypothetical protein